MGDLEEALRRAESAASEKWKSLALTAVSFCASTRDTITTDDVWDVLSVTDVSTHEPRALGPIMLKAMRAGLIEPLTCSHCGTEKVVRRSSRPERQEGDVTVYRPGPNAEAE